MTHPCGTAAVLIGLALLAPTAARPAADSARLPGENPRTAQRFGEAANREQGKRWAEAAEAYQRLIDEAGDDLVALDAGRQYVPARWLAHRRLAANPDLLTAYRARVETRARRLLELGQGRRDPQALTRLVEDLFCSRPAESALHALGDLAFERGDFEQARRYWQALEPTGASPVGPAYPGPLGDAALVRAKLILTRLFLGERGPAEADLRAFRAKYGDAAGYLAGRQGNLATLLADLARSTDLSGGAARADGPVADATFANAASRDGVYTPALPPFSPRQRYGPLVLPHALRPAFSDRPSDARQVQRPTARASALTCYPVISRGHVLVADARSVVAYDLATGDEAARFDPEQAGARSPRVEGLPPDFRTTLTVAGDRVYARFGRVRMRPAAGEDPKEDSYLAGLEFDPHPPAGRARLSARWLLPPPKSDTSGDAMPIWEGTPVGRAGRLYAAVTRFEGNRATTAVVCYDADEPQSGPLWQQDVCEVTGGTGEPRGRHELLTLAGPLVVCCSHAGTITALNAATGRRAWAARYPARTPQTDVRPQRDLAPCVYTAGRLFAAPADADRVFGLDAATGALLWESAPLEVVHLLGAVHGRVICTKGGFTSGITALRAENGRVIPDWGYEQPALEGAPVFGRGVLTPERIYWPTRYGGLVELRHEDGKVHDPQPVAFAQLPGGNLAIGDGCLAVATAERLYVLTGLSRDPAAKQDAMGREPTWKWNYGTALIAADEGATAEALAGFRRAEEMAGSSAVLRDRARRRRHELLLWQAERLVRQRRPEDGAATLQVAAAAEFPAPLRLQALARLADLWRSAGRPERAAMVWRSVAAARDLGDGTLTDDAGTPRSAKREAARRLGALARGPAADDQDPAEGRMPPPTRPPAPETAPLPWPLASAWHVRVPPGREWPLALIEGGLVLGAEAAVVVRSLPDGRERWRTPLPFAPRWAVAYPGGVVVAGPGGAARVRGTDGGVVWTFVPPTSLAGPGDSSPGWRAADADPAPAGELSSFQLAGGRLFALEGAARLLALDLDTGEPLWRRAAPAAGLPHARSGDRFHPEYLATAEFVLLQSTDGRRWTLDAATGRVGAVAPTSEEPWPTPVPVDDRRVVVAETTDGGEPRVALLDLAAGEEVWRYELPRWPSLNHELPRCRREGDVLLACVGRNYGTELERLDLGTGRPLGEALLLGRDPVGPESVAIVGDVTVVASGGSLRALAADGSERWSRPLEPAGDWRLRRADGNAVVAFPARAVPQGVGFAWQLAAYDVMNGDLLKQWDCYPRGPRAAVAAGTGLAALLDGEALGLTAPARGVR